MSDQTLYGDLLEGTGRHFGDPLSSIHIYGEPSENVLQQSHEKARLLGRGIVVVEPFHAGFTRVAATAEQGTTAS